MQNLDNITRGHQYGVRPLSGLSNAGADIMKNNLDLDRADLDPAIKDKIIADQVKINHLREEQQKTNKLMIDDFDQIDLLQNELNQKVRNNYPSTTRMPNASLNFQKSKDPLNGFNHTLPPNAGNSNNIGNDLQDLRKTYVNNGGEDPNLIK